ncbi:hypothetical protein M9Y10_002783 [Tritrichomonas musculus]|uniref:Tubby C-terminal domain-containing protein n=1 Tax=Tritrichomonas musculus TaxID=1915356 RepID=A0ABR2LBR0_9EUKA
MDATYALVTQQLEHIQKPIQNEQAFKCLFTKRFPKGKNSKPHCYFFSEDQEDLIISASYKNKKGTTYKMSLNSKQIKRKSLWYAGICSDIQTKKIFLGSFPNKPGSMAHAIRIDCNEENPQILLPPMNSENFIFTDMPQEGTIPLASSKSNDIGNSENPNFISINIFNSNQPVLTIHQIAEDEFEVQISYPLTIFQAFCIACVLTN